MKAPTASAAVAPLPARARVLLLEDSDLDAELLTMHLQRSQVALEIVRAARRGDFERALAAGGIDLVLSDYSLPDFDGMAALRAAREALPEAPFLFVSGVVGEDVATDALRQGATDYVLKRNLARLPSAIERALAEADERAQRRRVEAALGTSQTNTRLAVEAAQLGMWHYAPAARSFAWDARCQQMFGLDGQAQVSYADFLDRSHPADRDALDAALQAVLTHGPGGRLVHELRTLDGDGRERWVVMRGEVMVDPASAATPTLADGARLLGVLQDVTEQKLATERQHHAELMFRMAAEATGIGVWELDLEHGALWIDDGVRRLADLPQAETPTLQTMLDEVIHPEDRARVAEAMARASQPTSLPELDDEYRLIGRRNGRLRWVAIKGRRVTGPDGRSRLIGTLRDVTDAKRQEAALHQANEALEERVALRTQERDRIWNLSPDLMVVCRPDGTMIAANPAWHSLLGWRVEALLQADLLDFVDPADGELTRAHLKRLAEGAGTIRCDNRLRRHDGAACWIRWTASADHGLVYAIGRDVTAERAAADELARTNRELTAQIAERGRVETTLRQMQRLEAVGQLTAGVAHDFNNLLTVVLSNIGLIRRLLDKAPTTDARVVQRLDSMRAAAERGATLTAQLLAFSRRQRLEPQVLDLNDTVRSLRDLLQTTMGGSVQLQTELADALWPALVDPTQLELIVLNLAINARDAMEVGGSLTLRTANVTLTAPPARSEQPEPGEYVALSVADSGTGMSDEVLAKAFEPFFTTKEVGRGSGLGLAQVYGFAKQSGGGVRIDTALGHGTTVHVFIPRAQSAQVPAASGAQPPEPSVAPAEPGHTLLVVDDDPSVRDVTVSLLDVLGYRVVQAGSGAQAIELLRTRDDIELVIADFAMPGMNGADLARQLRETHPALPVLFFTGFVDLAALKDVPEEFVLQKPLRDNELAERLQRLLPRAA